MLCILTQSCGKQACLRLGLTSFPGLRPEEISNLYSNNGNRVFHGRLKGTSKNCLFAL